jgi:hypothetical protein
VKCRQESRWADSARDYVLMRSRGGRPVRYCAMPLLLAGTRFRHSWNKHDDVESEYLRWHSCEPIDAATISRRPRTIPVIAIAPSVSRIANSETVPLARRWRRSTAPDHVGERAFCWQEDGSPCVPMRRSILLHHCNRRNLPSTLLATARSQRNFPPMSIGSLFPKRTANPRAFGGFSADEMWNR